MKWIYKDDRPIYQQIVDQIKQGILTGIFPMGSPMPSVRELAAQAEVNPNTMQRALSELENENLVHSVRTSGRFVTEDEKMIIELKRSLSRKYIDTFLQSMRSLGLSDEETVELMQRGIKEGNTDERDNGMH